jgi:transcriptional regulator GlxA family with amidase domain
VIRIGLVLPPGFQAMSVAAMSAFELANACAENGLYEITTLSERGGAISSSAGMSIDTQQLATPCFDTLLVSGVLEVGPATRGLIAFVRRSLPICRRIGSICTGAFFLAEAGVLDGKRATTRWQFARELRDRFPKVKVEEDRIFIVDGSVWTAAGMSAGLDLALGMIRRDFGAALARSVAQRLSHPSSTRGCQSQHSPLPALDAKSDRISKYKRNLREDLTVERLANIARLGRR